MAGQERTESATPKRRQEARRRGQVARSPEFTAGLLMVASVLLLRTWAGSYYLAFTGMMRGTLALIADPNLTRGSFRLDYVQTALWIVATVGPLFAALLVIGLVVNVGQVGFFVTFTPLMPDFGRVNPMAGFQRIFSKRALIELLKAVFKVVVVGFVLYRVLSGRMDGLLVLEAMDLRSAASMGVSVVYDVLFYGGLALLVIASLDYAYQRFNFERSIRMTKEELKEEMKQSEGSPQTKMRIRRRQRALAQRRMMQQVPKAAVVITNPTHFAVALAYSIESAGAPRVVAKGQDLVAQQIKRIAAEHDVPVVENKPLAQALFKSVEIDQEIPGDLYRAVAEVLAFIMVMKQRRAALGSPPSAGPDVNAVAGLPEYAR